MPVKVPPTSSARSRRRCLRVHTPPSLTASQRRDALQEESGRDAAQLLRAEHFCQARATGAKHKSERTVRWSEIIRKRHIPSEECLLPFFLT